MSETGNVLSIALHHGVNAEHELYRLRRGTTLRLVPGSSLLGRKVALYCNYPVTDKAEFIREQYLHLNWYSKDGKKLSDGLHPFTQITDTEAHCEVILNRSGTFHFYFVYDDNLHKRQGSLYVQVEPQIRVGGAKTSQNLPLNAIRCQTVMAKCLGPLSTWEKKLLVTKNSGYNLLHFTPIQVRLLSSFARAIVFHLYFIL